MAISYRYGLKDLRENDWNIPVGREEDSINCRHINSCLMCKAVISLCECLEAASVNQHEKLIGEG